MNLNNLKERLMYCREHGADCLLDWEMAFIEQMWRERQDRGDVFYLHPKQARFMRVCFSKVIRAHPFQRPTSGLAAMKAKKAALDAAIKRRARIERQARQIVAWRPPEPAAGQDVIQARRSRTRQQQKSSQTLKGHFEGE